MPARFGRLNLDTSRPGFYDDPVFVAREREDPTLLEAYAGFVERVVVDERYANYVRARVQETAAFLLDELKADGRRGACIDISCAVSRFLERQGVWNYMVRGAVTISFPSWAALPPAHFWPLGNGASVAGASAAHMWVRAPPFAVVDLTLAMQPFALGEERFIPEAVIAENPSRVAVDLSDLLDPELREELGRRLQRAPELSDLPLVNPGLLDRIRSLGAWEVHNGGTKVRYVACAVSAPDLPMETAKNVRLRGKYLIDLWRAFDKAHHPPAGVESN